jgi:hypothetical protein
LRAGQSQLKCLASLPNGRPHNELDLWVPNIRPGMLSRRFVCMSTVKPKSTKLLAREHVFRLQRSCCRSASSLGSPMNQTRPTADHLVHVIARDRLHPAG